MSGETFKYLLLSLLATLVVSWPALVNGGPFLHPDSSYYIRSGDAVAASVLGSRTEWSAKLVPMAQSSAVDSAVHNPSATSAKPTSRLKPTRAVLSGRSIFYGISLFGSIWLFGFMGPVFVQSAIVVGLTVLIMRTLPFADERRRLWWTTAALSVTALLTPLPYFASTLMPDVYAGVFVLCVLSLMFQWEQYGSRSRLALLTLGAVSVTFHSTFQLLALAILALGVFAVLLMRSFPAWRLCIPLAGVLIFSGANAIYSKVIDHQLGAPPVNVPFLSARIIADGPGYDFLRETCPGSGFILCRYLSRMRQDSDTFLWAENPEFGVFSAVPIEERRRIGAEDKRFLMAVLGRYPLSMVGASLSSGARQLVTLGMENYNYSADHQKGYSSNYPAQLVPHIETTAAYRNAMPVRLMQIASLAAFGFALAVVGVLIWRGWRANRTLNRYQTLVLVAVLCVVANGMICGAFSKPHSRYQMRILWLASMAAVIALSQSAGASPSRLSRQPEGGGSIT